MRLLVCSQAHASKSHVGLGAVKYRAVSRARHKPLAEPVHPVNSATHRRQKKAVERTLKQSTSKGESYRPLKHWNGATPRTCPKGHAHPTHHTSSGPVEGLNYTPKSWFGQAIRTTKIKVNRAQISTRTATIQSVFLRVPFRSVSPMPCANLLVYVLDRTFW